MALFCFLTKNSLEIMRVLDIWHNQNDPNFACIVLVTNGTGSKCPADTNYFRAFH